MMRKLWRLMKAVVIGVLLFVVLALIYELATFPRVAKLRDNNPETTAMIETRMQEARERGEQPRRVQQWVPLERISVHLLRAVLAGEDSNFATHNGFDYEAIQKAWDQAQRDAAKEAKQQGEDESSWIPAMPNFKRGASTISQQLAKNLYLTTERSFVRKAREAAITYFMEKNLSKRRILEIYLNVIEWGDGIYGAEAASRTYFRKSAADLTADEAAFLSAIIPNPRTEFNPQLKPKRVARRKRIIARGMPYVRLP
ncbi:MAG TPA: transglycosylase domain-containing protein [Pyrinomonadaceae bacterium]|nr:transglycosylase domain-containing protein [Pyrinomonadaceae bacterium]